MKKLSISMFAVLAIAFAVTSAFTTTQNSTAKTTYSDHVIVGVEPSALLTSETDFSTIVANRETSPVDGILYNSNTDPQIADEGEMATWLDAQNVVDGSSRHWKFFCNTNGSYLCVVKFYQNTIDFFVSGDFTPTEIL